MGFSPLMQAGGADAFCVERVPLVSAGAEPLVFFAERPAAQWAAVAWGLRRAGVLLLLKPLQGHGQAMPGTSGLGIAISKISAPPDR